MTRTPFWTARALIARLDLDCGCRIAAIETYCQSCGKSKQRGGRASTRGDDDRSWGASRCGARWMERKGQKWGKLSRARVARTGPARGWGREEHEVVTRCVGDNRVCMTGRARARANSPKPFPGTRSADNDLACCVDTGGQAGRARLSRGQASSSHGGKTTSAVGLATNSYRKQPKKKGDKKYGGCCRVGRRDGKKWRIKVWRRESRRDYTLRGLSRRPLDGGGWWVVVSVVVCCARQKQAP